MVNKVYVFIEGIEDTPLLCGQLVLNQDNTTSFTYSDSFLSHPDAFPLDPLNLPLDKAPYHCDAINCTFGVFTDSGADSWGKKVLHSIYPKQPQNILEYLLAYSGTGVGCLRFSLSRNSIKSRRHQNKLKDIPQIITAKNQVLSDSFLSQASATVLSKGIGIGGARPKSIVAIDGIKYIAKFQRKDDKFNHVRAEHATMTMLHEITDNVAKTQMIDDFGEDVLLVKRFDLENGRPAHHFISGHSVINMNKVKESMAVNRYSYGFLAEFLLEYGAEPERDAEELFKRMVFNVLIGNTDDHPRNHAILYSFKDKGWRLSPAYDVIKGLYGRKHGMGVGMFGRAPTFSNLLSQTHRFNLDKEQVKKTFQDITSYFRNDTL